MKKTLISGNDLEDFIISFLDGIKKDIESGISDLTIKITEQSGTFGKIYVVRCTIFEKLISKLTKMANTSSKPFQHDTLKVFLAYILLDITKILFEKKKIDITVKTHNSLDVTYEVRTRHNLLWKEVALFIKEQYREMIHSENRKNVWWLTFLNKLDKEKWGIDGSAGLDGLEKIGTSSKNSKGKNRRVCFYCATEISLILNPHIVEPFFQGTRVICGDSNSKGWGSKASVEMYQNHKFSYDVGLYRKDSWLINMNSWLKLHDKRAVKRELKFVNTKYKQHCATKKAIVLGTCANISLDSPEQTTLGV